MKELMPTANKCFLALLLMFCQLFFHSKCYSQISLDYGDFGVLFKPEKRVDTFHFTLEKYYPGFTLKIFLEDYGGACSIELYDKKNQLKMTGTYVNGPDTLVKYNFAKQLGPPFDKKYYSVQTMRYLTPLKKGLWKYYGAKGNIVDSFRYDYRFL